MTGHRWFSHLDYSSYLTNLSNYHYNNISLWFIPQQSLSLSVSSRLLLLKIVLSADRRRFVFLHGAKSSFQSRVHSSIKVLDDKRYFSELQEQQSRYKIVTKRNILRSIGWYSCWLTCHLLGLPGFESFYCLLKVEKWYKKTQFIFIKQIVFLVLLWCWKSNKYVGFVR